MHEAVRRLKTFAECEEFAKLVERRDAELAIQARRKAVELRAAAHGAQTLVEKEIVRAVYAYEEAASTKKGRRTPATRTWQMIRRYGIIGASDRVVRRTKETTGYSTLADVGMLDFAFEAVVLRYPDSFSPEAVAQSRQRLADRNEPELQA
jgi:hypothetical protein